MVVRFGFRRVKEGCLPAADLFAKLLRFFFLTVLHELHHPRLCESAAKTLADLVYDSVQVQCGDGYGGWPDEAPFDGIVVTAAPEWVPDPLLEQLAVGAKMVIPVGDFYQELKVITRTAEGYDERSVIPVRFVPMTGEVERQGGQDK